MNKLDKKRNDLVERFTKARGYFSKELWGDLLELDPGFFEQYMNFSAYPNKNGVLPRKFKELIYIAINASTTHLYEPALRTHIRSALRAGATKEEILEVLEMTSVLGIHTCTLGVPILAKELQNQAKK
jgi:alkylhydroperoxidase/carboxymuconolactone decarboxylase family protein YurZ